MPKILPEESEIARLLPSEGMALGDLHICTRQWTNAQEGIVFSVMLGKTACEIWLLGSDWQAWCEGMIGSSAPESVDACLLFGIAEWGLSPLIAASGAEMLRSISDPIRYSILPDQIALTFSWQIEHYQFHTLLFNWPTTYFQTITKQVLPRARSLRLLPPIPFACYSGWCLASFSELRNVSVGMGLRMHAFGDLRAGDGVLLLLTGIAARVCMESEERMKINELVQDVESLMQEERDHTDCLQSVAVDIDDLPQKVLVEVGQVDISLGALRSLCEGDLLPAEAQFSSEVKLRLNGRVIGLGELIGCGDSFLVRVSYWYLNAPEQPYIQEDTVNT
ncbi:YscQ/HrcQ family type III secretion apparatus protein [Yersinia mollaretii]|uniref:YscQ/HrcQ family type III secretion apparatus protein n=1 Tax=Yersinia mollaretii TaxID=33060 RepID=UPI0011A3B144|nr:YscQ/HrcQ family type III secretion apparatus protein [Yersinia mollaretii]